MNITVKDLLKIYNPKIIDIRTIENYNNNHIPGAINIPYNNLLISPQKYLNKNETYYIYCKHGKTSQGLCNTLINQGYHVINVLGGYEAYILNK